MKKLVVITGASSGIGYQMAKLFIENGYPTLLIARRIELLDEFSGSNVLIKKVDVTDKSAFEQAINEAVDTFGPVDLLINNAGCMLLGDITVQDPSEWQQMLDVNVTGVLNGMQIVLGSMRNLKTGTIINISSIAGVKPFGNHAAYCGTKYAVHGITQTVQQEVSSDNVRVMIIAPGACETELLGHTTDTDIKAGYEQWKLTM